MKTVAVFGAGIAGLSAAHEFARLGYDVSVYESTSEPGGFFRSARFGADNGMPSEYSWHGFGPWYHNAFDVMKQIPFEGSASVYDKSLSRPIDFGVVPDRGVAQFDDTWPLPVSRMLRMSGFDSCHWAWLMLKTWCSNRRTLESYSEQNAAEAWRPLLSDLGYRTWRATFGPWVGSDWTKASLHTVGQFFLKLLISGPPHAHAADADGPAWSHGSGDNWLLLRGPSSEWWFDKWIKYLGESGVRIHYNQPLERLDYNGHEITSARLASGEAVKRDVYVIAINPFSAADILDRTPALLADKELRKFRPLVQDGPHTQVSFRIAFGEKIRWPRKRTAVIIADSEFDLTLFAEDQVWAPEVELGDGIKSLWTGTACVGTYPGRLFGLPVEHCTKQQFIEEVMAQLSSCDGLDRLIREANAGRGWRSFPITRIEVWHEWLFSEDGIQPDQPKWVTTTHTQPYQPQQKTSIPNLVLAGAHTNTQADVWSIEGAVESGRRAAKAIEPAVRVLPQYKPLGLRALSAADDVCYAAGLPHFLDLTRLLAVAGAFALLGCWARSSWSRRVGYGSSRGHHEKSNA